MQRKTTSVQDQPQLHSLLRLGHQVNKLKKDLNEAENKALDLAKDRIVESPRSNARFKQTVAKKVEFASQEKIFNQLTSLDLSTDPPERKRSGKKGDKTYCGKRDPEPVLSDFHQPYYGEPIPMLDDDKTIRDLVLKNLHKAENSPQQFIINSNKIQNKFEL